MRKLANDFTVGDLVFCPDAERFLQPYRTRLKGRNGVVIEIAPLDFPGKSHYSRFNEVRVKWLKRGNRGKEFIDWMSPRDIEACK